MAVRDVCEVLIAATDPVRVDRLLHAAANRADSASRLTDAARTVLSADPPEAVRRADLAVRTSALRGAAGDEAEAWRVRAQGLRMLARHDEALDAFDRAVEAAGRAHDPLLAARVQIGRVDSLGWLGRVDEAFALARLLEASLRRLGADVDAAKVLVNTGNLHFRRDEHVAALRCYERAQGLLEAAGDAVDSARVAWNRANILTTLSRTGEAIALYDRARAVFEDRSMSAETAMIDFNLAYLRHISGELTLALALISRARREFAGRDAALEAAKCDSGMADVYREINLLPEALVSYDRAIGVFETIGLDYERAIAEMGRAAVLASLDREDDALQALDLAAGLFDQQKNRVQVAMTRLMRASILRSMGRTEEAATEAEEARRVLRRNQLYGWAGEAGYLLADMALDASDAAIPEMQSVARAAKRHSRGWLECRAHRSLGRHFERRGDFPRALRHYRASVGALEQARTLIVPEDMHVSFLRDKLAVYENLVGLLLSRENARDTAEALQHVERSKSRLLLERVQSTLDSRTAPRDNISRDLRRRLADLRAELSREYRRANASAVGDQRSGALSLREATRSLRPLEQAYTAALREAELLDIAAAPSLGMPLQVVSAQRLMHALQPDEMLLEYYVVDGWICAFLVRPGATIVRRRIGSLADAINLARRLRYYVQRGAMSSEYLSRHGANLRAGTEDVLRRLHDALLAPVEADLKCAKLVIVPHGPLHGLPFHAFYDGERHALDRWEIIYSPSAAVWYNGTERTTTNPAHRRHDPALNTLLIGVPAPGIEQVSQEVQELASMVPNAEQLIGEQATVSAFLSRAPAFQRLHLAMHAVFRADNPLFSGLQFADGRVLARDLYDLRLDCDLATLSACQTGVALVEVGDELFGLLRGFLAAGVRTLAASLWPADDTATARMMVRFYDGLSNGLSKAAALQHAQCVTRADYPDPYYWAAFALVGER